MYVFAHTLRFRLGKPCKDDDVEFAVIFEGVDVLFPRKIHRFFRFQDSHMVEAIDGITANLDTIL
jgi:hypothetical protein